MEEEEKEMSVLNTDFFMLSDATTDRVPQQNLDGVEGFAIQGAANLRSVNGQMVSDSTVNPRGAKNIVWCSEGFTLLGKSINALTGAEKMANGTHAINIGVAAPLDFSAYHRVIAMISLTSLTAGSTPSITFEIDFQDDETSPLTLPVWTSAALTAAGSLYTCVGSGVHTSVPTPPSGWTYALVDIPLAPNGQFKWTVAGTPTAAAWVATLYGLN